MEARDFSRVRFHTHMVSEDLSLEELYCDDTEIIEEELKRYQNLADFHNQIVNTMRKYQKIKEIIENWKAGTLEQNDSIYAFHEIMGVVEDENDD